MIPDFCKHGILPEGIHRCSIEEFELRFVASFPESNTRPPIWRGFVQFRKDVTAHGLCGAQWVDGSYVTKKPDPGDIDVVTLSDADHLNSLPDASQKALLQFFKAWEETKRTYQTHAFLLPVMPKNHPLRNQFEKAVRSWRDLWSHDRYDATSRKGFVQLEIGNGGAIHDLDEQMSPAS